jgi:hypothetical protein
MNQLSEQKGTRPEVRGRILDHECLLGPRTTAVTRRGPPRLFYWTAAAPDRHEKKLAHHAGGIAEQREKFRKLLCTNFARGHTGGRELLHGKSISFRSGRTALEHTRLTFTR